MSTADLPLVTVLLDLRVHLDVWGQATPVLDDADLVVSKRAQAEQDGWRVALTMYAGASDTVISSPSGVEVLVRHAAMYDSARKHYAQVLPHFAVLVGVKNASAQRRLWHTVVEVHEQALVLARRVADRQHGGPAAATVQGVANLKERPVTVVDAQQALADTTDLREQLAWAGAGFAEAGFTQWKPVFTAACDPFSSASALVDAMAFRDAGFDDPERAVQWLPWYRQAKQALLFSQAGWSREEADAVRQVVGDAKKAAQWARSGLSAQRALLYVKAGLTVTEAKRTERSGTSDGPVDLLAALR